MAQKVVNIAGAITLPPFYFGLGLELLTLISFSDHLVVFMQFVGGFYSLRTRHIFTS